MTVQEFIKSKLPAVKEIIIDIKVDEFDSHEFIRHFKKKFEADYSRFLARYKSDNHRTVHIQIAKSLSKYSGQLGIRKEKNVNSLSVFGNYVPNKKWIKN